MRVRFSRHRAARRAWLRTAGRLSDTAHLGPVPDAELATPRPMTTGYEPWPINRSGPSWGSAVRPDRTGIGHQHLLHMLRVHEDLLRCGVVAAATGLTMREVAQAAAACRYFELDTLAELMLRIPHVTSSAEAADAFDAVYRDRVASGVSLSRAIRTKVAARPGDFPLRPV
jgi:hypothetical protein